MVVATDTTIDVDALVYGSTNDHFDPLIEDTSRYLILYGGAGSGKSFFAATKLIGRMLANPSEKFLIIRKVAKTIRESCFALLLDIIRQWGVADLFSFNKVEMSITCKLNGSRIICVGIDDEEKVKSIHGITSIWVEEATELTKKELHQLNLRMRGLAPAYRQMIVTFNPISAQHWLKARFFDNLVMEVVPSHGGLVNTGKRARVRIDKSTYLDNAFCDPEYIQELEAMKVDDPGLHQIYTLGNWGVMEGLIYPIPDVTTPEPAAFDESIYGLDFGYNNPTALVKCSIRDREVWLKEILYQTGLTNSDLIARMEGLSIPRGACIYADSAEPDRIQEIQRAGYNVRPAAKGKNSVKNGIDFCQRLKLHSETGNSNLNAEFNTYAWKQHKDGRTLDEPVKFADHALDAMRYALTTHLKQGVSFRGVSRSLIGV